MNFYTILNCRYKLFLLYLLNILSEKGKLIFTEMVNFLVKKMKTKFLYIALNFIYTINHIYLFKYKMKKQIL